MKRKSNLIEILFNFVVVYVLLLCEELDFEIVKFNI
jgi:hypothetical protein